MVIMVSLRVSLRVRHLPSSQRTRGEVNANVEGQCQRRRLFVGIQYRRRRLFGWGWGSVVGVDAVGEQMVGWTLLEGRLVGPILTLTRTQTVTVTVTVTPLT